MKKRTFAAPLFLAALLLGGCTIRSAPPTPTGAPAPAAVTPAPETPAPLRSFTVSYYDGEELLCRQTLPEGDAPGAYIPGGIAPFLGWLDEDGGSVSPETVPLAGDVRYTASFGPTLARGVPYLTAESGIFRPGDALSRREAAELLYALLPETPPLPEEPVAEALLFAPDAALDNTGMNAATKSYEAVHYPTAETNPRTESLRKLSALIGAGLLPPGMEEDPLCSEQAVGREALLLALAPYLREGLAENAPLTETPTRLEVALWLNGLLMDSGETEYPFADLDPGSEEAAAASLSCGEWAVGEGMTLLGCGKLYYIEGGRVLRDGDVGTLRFGADGAYTSGSEELDALCRDAVIRTVNLADDGERRLRSVYTYVRDRFAYLRRNYYDTGEHGWELEEATHMLSTHYGNCYSFAAAFWALARSLGYDAHAVSGTQGQNFAPHGWVWMDMEDGLRCFYDVEAEYAALRDGYSLNPMFRMTYGVATNQWLYVFNAAAEGFAS